MRIRFDGKEMRCKDVRNNIERRSEKMQIVLAGVFLIPLFSLLVLIVMSGCTLLGILWERGKQRDRRQS